MTASQADREPYETGAENRGLRIPDRVYHAAKARSKGDEGRSIGKTTTDLLEGYNRVDLRDWTALRILAEDRGLLLGQVIADALHAYAVAEAGR